MTDLQIIELFWERSQQAIEETQRIYGRYCQSVAYGILGDREEAREIVNDTYLKLWNLIPPERPDSLKGFLGMITRQLAINRLKANHRQKRGAGQYRLALDELQECIPDPCGEADVENLTALRDFLNRFLRLLPREGRCVFIRRYWHMYSIDEIAREFGMSRSKVKSMLMRIRNQLKEHLTKEGFDL